MTQKKSWGKLVLSSMIACTLVACSEKTERATATEKSSDNNQQVTINTTKPRYNAANLPNYLHRSIEEEVFYFVMPDRFANGEPSNDNGSKTIKLSQGGFDPSHKGMYHGGDIKGLQDKLPYLKNMGISAIWLTPIMRNKAVQGPSAGYHGYWVLDFTQIDPHLGSNDELKAFIDAAHQENIKVFFDIITNHTADVIKYQECHEADGTPKNACEYRSLAEVKEIGTYTPFLPKGEENVKVPAWLNDPKYYHNQGETTYEGENSIYGDFASLDDINTDDPEVVQGMIDIFKGVVSEFKPDGFRIDTVKHVNIEFWSEFSPAVIEHAKSIGIPEFFMFGEVYDPNPDVLSKYTSVGKVPSVLDFGFQQAVADTLVAQKGTDVFAQLFAQDDKYLDEDSHPNKLLNFVGNHDMGRFAHFLAISEHNYSEQEKIDRLLLAHALMYFSRGVPVIYYGDEQGFVGDGHDQDSRQNMEPSHVASYNDDDLLATDKTTADNNFDQEHLFYQTFAKYADIYYQHQALRSGRQEVVYSQATPGLYAFTRTDKESTLLITVNTNNKAIEQTVSFNNSLNLVYADKAAQQQVTVKNGAVNISLPALSFAIYQVQ